MKVTVERVLSSEDAATIYPTYAHAWDPLLTRAAARHVLTEEEFVKEMSDPRIEKVLVRNDDGQAVGLTTFTNDLSAVEWINPEFYREHYPDAVARGAMFYLGYTLVDQGRRSSRALAMMAKEVTHRVARARGVIGYDICAYNDAHGVGRYTGWVFGSADEIGRLDTQSYYAADYRSGVEALTRPRAGVQAATRPAVRTTLTLAERPDLAAQARDVLISRWPPYLPAGGLGHGLDLDGLVRAGPEHQVLAVDDDDEVVGVGLSVPLRWDGTRADLPAGRDDALGRGRRQLEAGGTPDAVCLLSLTVAAGHERRGIGTRLLEHVRRGAADCGAAGLLAPVRPVLKSRYPLVDIQTYLRWRTEDGDLFDPWLRLHLRLGGHVLGVSDAPTSVTASLSQWRCWLDDPLPGDGGFVVPGALAPLMVEGPTGTYVEPSVWVLHRTDQVPTA